MPKTIKEMTIQLDLSKDSDGEIQVEASAHVAMGTTEYPDINYRKGITLELTGQQETAVINFAKTIIQKVKAGESAEDAIPVPPKPPPPEPEPIE